MRKLSELKISPAPWKCAPMIFLDDDSPAGLYVKDSDGNDVATDIDGASLIQQEANARLIAAAPELYKWLAFAVEQYKCEMRSCNNCPNGKCWVVDATAALAEAAGESEAHNE